MPSRFPQNRPGGTIENSPAIYCRGQFRRELRPSGTLEIAMPDVSRKSFKRPIRDATHWTGLPGNKLPGYFQKSLRDFPNSRRLPTINGLPYPFIAAA
jgi:hypothetical protein